MLAPQHMPVFGIRNDLDTAVVEEVWQENVYRLGPDSCAGLPVIDVGAHIGAFSLLALHRGATKVFAVEAHPDNFATLERNIARNEVGGMVETFHSAITDHATHLFMDTAEASPSGMALPAGLAGDIVRGAPIEGVSLVALMRLAPRFGLLKLDCEGPEWAVILATPSEVLNQCRTIVGEWHPSSQTALFGGTPGAAVQHLLRTHHVEVFGHPEHGGMFFAQVNDTDSPRWRTACPYGDQFCPCQDGDLCHYEGPDPMTPPEAPA